MFFGGCGYMAVPARGLLSAASFPSSPNQTGAFFFAMVVSEVSDLSANSFLGYTRRTQAALLHVIYP